MTSNIKGPEGPRPPQPRGPSPVAEAGASLSERLGQILMQRASGQSAALSGRAGGGTDAPSGGMHAGKREDGLRDLAARIQDQRSRALAAIQSGQLGLGAVIDGLLGGAGRADGTPGLRLAASLREALPKGLGQSTGSVGRDADLRSLTGDAVTEFSQQVVTFIDTLFGDGREGLLAGCLDTDLRDTLRHEAGEVLDRNPGDQAGQRVRAHCLDILILKAVLPAVARDGGDIRGLVHVATGNTNGLSPALANALDPLVAEFATRFDGLLRKLEIPGIGQ